MRLVVPEILALLVLLGEELFRRFQLPLAKSIQFVFSPYIGQYAEDFDTRHADMIASTRGKGPWHLFCSASRTRLLKEAPAEVLEQGIGLLENPRE